MSALGHLAYALRGTATVLLMYLLGHVSWSRATSLRMMTTRMCRRNRHPLYGCE